MEKLKQASERWIKEGEEFKGSLNTWLDTIYIGKTDPDTACPEETREDMGEYVLEQLKKFNEEGRQAEFRELFPTDNDPIKDLIHEDSAWYQIQRVALLTDDRIVAKLGDYYQWQGVYILDGDEYSLQDELIGFGHSHDKQFFAKVYTDKIVVCKGWDGEVIAELVLPADFDGYKNIELFSDGKSGVLITHYGIFHINEKEAVLIHTEGNNDDEEEEENEITASNEGPAKPACVPAEAVWNASEGEWETGTKNSHGNPVGLWKWWLAPKGYLCCETMYHGAGGNVFTFTRFHEDGTPSRKGTYVDGQPFGEIEWFRSDNPTIENYPPKAGKEVFKTVSTIKGGYTVEEHYYDKNGNEIQKAYISNVEASELMQKLAVLGSLYEHKNWAQVIKHADEMIESEIAEDDDMDQMKVLYCKAYALYELNGKQNNEEITELADQIMDLYTFAVWEFLPEYEYAVKAIAFAKKITPRTDDEENEDEEEDEDERTFLDYPHAVISPDDKYVVVGSQNSAHIILKNEDGKWIQTGVIAPRSSYPHIARFNYKMKNNDGEIYPIVALSSCHFSQSGTLAIAVKDLEGIEASGWTLDHAGLWVVDDQKWIFSMFDSARGFYYGSNDGYIWLRLNCNDKYVGYLFVGGTPLSIDIIGSTMVIGTSTGQIIKYKWEPQKMEEGKNPRIDPLRITNLPLRDEKRYLFPMGESPLIW